MTRLYVLSICLCVLWTVTPGSAINWLNSHFNLNVSDLVIEDVANATFIPWIIEVAVSSNREIYRKDGGHFRLSIRGSDSKMGDFSALSPCVEVGAASAETEKLIESAEVFVPGNSSGIAILSDIIDISIKRYGDGKLASNFSTLYRVYFRSSSVYTMEVEVLQTGCTPLQTFGYWNDARNWEGGVVPTDQDEVFFPSLAGMVELSADVTVQSLNMLGGTLILQSTGCNDGWSLGPETGSLE